jgi:hypothetical protein
LFRQPGPPLSGGGPFFGMEVTPIDLRNADEMERVRWHRARSTPGTVHIAGEIEVCRGSLNVGPQPINDQLSNLKVVLLDDKDMAVALYPDLRQDQRFRYATCVQQGLLGGVHKG